MLHRFFAPVPLTIGETVAVAGDEAHHGARVVRLREGEEIELFDGAGNAARGTVEAIARDHIHVRLTDAVEARESPTAITLGMAIIHLDKFELVLQKATELGVHAIVPLVTDHVDLRPERYRGKAERWERIVFEAVKQCGRARVPKVAEPVKFDEVVDDTCILFDLSGGPLPSAVRAAEGSGPPLTLLIGPEGGFSERELALARERNARFERLGPRRLRAETAAIVGLSIIAARHGDLW